MIGKVVVLHVHKHPVEYECKKAQLNHLGIRADPFQVGTITDTPLEPRAGRKTKGNHCNKSEQAREPVVRKHAEENVVSVPDLSAVLHQKVGSISCEDF